ncbi:hypothetical protein AB0I69_46630 [Streptomyces sp. NPDC050508]|uniref:hypothetical protein n=1 Tax=Streptomyces sp. NPDC050508 TaxID=3155405 RepID=UPI003436A3AC
MRQESWRPSVLAHARQVGMSNTAFRRNYLDIGLRRSEQVKSTSGAPANATASLPETRRSAAGTQNCRLPGDGSRLWAPHDN